jgi:hypothetical protein
LQQLPLHARTPCRNKRHYSKHVITHGGQGQFKTQYDSLVPDTIYVKTDDDIIYIDPMAIELMVREKLERSRYLYV